MCFNPLTLNFNNSIKITEIERDAQKTIALLFCDRSGAKSKTKICQKTQLR